MGGREVPHFFLGSSMGEYGMNSDCCVRIERFANGFTVEIKDPAIVKYNALPYDPKKSRPYKEPWKPFVFKTAEEVITFLTKNLKKAMVSKSGDDADEFSTAWNMATTESDDG
jgi:hypothetical protein